MGSEIKRRPPEPGRVEGVWVEERATRERAEVKLALSGGAETGLYQKITVSDGDYIHTKEGVWKVDFSCRLPDGRLMLREVDMDGKDIRSPRMLGLLLDEAARVEAEYRAAGGKPLINPTKAVGGASAKLSLSPTAASDRREKGNRIDFEAFYQSLPHDLADAIREIFNVLTNGRERNRIFGNSFNANAIANIITDCNEEGDGNDWDLAQTLRTPVELIAYIGEKNPSSKDPEGLKKKLKEIVSAYTKAIKEFRR